MILIRFLAVARRAVFSVLRLQTLGACVLAVDAADNVVLVRNSYGPHVWTLPGGGLHRGETFRDGARREACEEAGILVADDESLELLGLYLQKIGGWSNHVAVFIVRDWTIETRTTWEIAEVAHFPLNDLPSNVGAAVRRRIAEWHGTRPLDPYW